jgi:hypothetical protein
MIATQNDQLTNEQIKQHLYDVAPWLAVDTNVSMLRGCTIQNIANQIARMEGSLVIAAEWREAWREHLSIYLEAEDGYAFQKAFFEKKKAEDDARELASLRSELKNVRIVSQQGERLDVNTLTLPTLRQHKADIENHIRMKGMTAGDLRAEYLAKHPAPKKRLDGYPILPQQMVLPNGLKIGDWVADGIHAVEMTPELIHAFSRAKSDSAEWHFYRFRLVRAYGAGQVSERQQISIPTGAGEGQSTAP